MRKRIPLKPDRADRVHVERVIRDWAGIISSCEPDSEPGREGRQALFFWLFDVWFGLREAGYSRDDLLEQLGELTAETEAILKERDPVVR